MVGEAAQVFYPQSELRLIAGPSDGVPITGQRARCAVSPRVAVWVSFEIELEQPDGVRAADLHPVLLGDRGSRVIPVRRVLHGLERVVHGEIDFLRAEHLERALEGGVVEVAAG